MEKIKYDSLYKFIVSIGIGIILLPFIFIFSVLKINDIIIIKVDEINQLTDTAKKIIYIEQNYKYEVLSHPMSFLIISGLFIIIGLFIVLYGIIQWKNKVQKLEDKSRELSNKLLEKQIKGLTDEEKKEKIREGIEIVNNDNLNENTNKQQMSKFINIQEKVYKVIRKKFNEYKVFEEVRLEKHMYDCLALNTTEYYFYDYIFEIKYYSTIKSINKKLKLIEESTEKAAFLYYKDSKRFARAILIIIVENFTEKDEIENQKILNEINTFNKENNYRSQIIVSNVDEIEEKLSKIKKY